MSENESKPLICRFCLILIDKNFIYINNYVTISSMIKFFLPETNIEISSEPVICQVCHETLQLSTDFKNNCLQNEEQTRFYFTNENPTFTKLDLKRFIISTKTGTDAIIEICRLCFQVINDNNNFTKLTSDKEILIRGMVQTTIPEIDLELTIEPVACGDCIIKLHSSYNFKNMCLQTEEKIYSYCEQFAFSSNTEQQINLFNIIENNPPIIDEEEKVEVDEDKKSEIKIDTNDNDILLGLKSTIDCLNANLATSGVKPSPNSPLEVNSTPNSPLGMNSPLGVNSTPNLQIVDSTADDVKSEEMDKKTIYCPTCPFQAEYKGDLYKHMVKHTLPNSDNMFKCILCDYLSKRKSHVVAHISIHIKPEDMRMFKCTICSFQSKRKVNVTQHMITHKPVDSIQMFKCLHCPYEAKWKSSLKQHLQTHNLTDIKMHKCTECTFQTKWSSNLKSHILLHNNPIALKTFKCPDCPFQAKYLSTYNKHMNNEHEKEGIIRMFKCTECSHQTKRKSNLKAHLELHFKKRKRN